MKTRPKQQTIELAKIYFFRLVFRVGVLLLEEAIDRDLFLPVLPCLFIFLTMYLHISEWRLRMKSMMLIGGTFFARTIFGPFNSHIATHALTMAA